MKPLKRVFFFTALFAILISPQIIWAAEWYETIESSSVDYASVQRSFYGSLGEKTSLKLDEKINRTQIAQQIQCELESRSDFSNSIGRIPENGKSVSVQGSMIPATAACGSSTP